MTRLLMMVLLPAVFAMPAVPGELFRASENIAEIASYVEAHLMAIVSQGLQESFPIRPYHTQEEALYTHLQKA